MTGRVPAFVAVGAGGFLLQMVALYTLEQLLRWPYLLATLLAVETAVLHNFLWHERWTWRDRGETGPARWHRLLRYHVGTGVASIAGNLLITMAGVEWLGLPTLVANATAVAATSVANFLVADRWVFRAPATSTFALLLALGASSPADAADLRAETVQAWERHVKDAERTVDGTLARIPIGAPAGRRIPVPSGTIHEWRGAVLVPSLTVEQLVHALETPGLPPPSDDVLEARVLAKDGPHLRVYLKILRAAIISVTYDTVHDVVFTRHTPVLATSRSVATLIREDGGGDHGFLWRLNSYWRYEQRGDDVMVTLFSLSLSRDVPMIARPVASPIIDGIARESVVRTLDAVERFGRQIE